MLSQAIPSYPAASMGGDTFVIAAQNAGLPTDINTLNKIVNLVNQGMAPEMAAKMIAEQSSSKSQLMPMIPMDMFKSLMKSNKGLR